MQPGFLLRKTEAPNTAKDARTIKVLRENMIHLQGKPSDYDSILKACGDATVVMIGEASHGTEEFYRKRAEITQRLITEKGFNFVGVEGDWPDVYRINRYVQSGRGCKDRNAKESLGDFHRFPKWMWRNYAVQDFTEWLRQHNNKAGEGPKAGFYGLDMYSLFTSVDAIIQYLDKVDPPMAQQARQGYGKLFKYRDDEHQYSADVTFKMAPSREKEVTQILQEIMRRGPDYLKGAGGLIDGDEFFYTTQNARLVKSAEEYYRKAYFGGSVTWNIRDGHMCETLENLLDYYRTNKGVTAPKAIIWAHNSHLGDSSATEYKRETGEENLGFLVRKKFGLKDCFNVGFTSNSGTVTAASKWGGDRQTFDLTPAFEDSYESLLHIAEPSDFLLMLRSNDPSVQVKPELTDVLRPERSERMVGVQYVKHRERSAHYVPCCLPAQFDSVIHVDYSTALQALD